MPREAIVEWGFTLAIFVVLFLACVQAMWPAIVATLKTQPKEEPERFPEPADVYAYPRFQIGNVETRAEAEARAIIEQCWPDEVI